MWVETKRAVDKVDVDQVGIYRLVYPFIFLCPLFFTETLSLFLSVFWLCACVCARESGFGCVFFFFFKQIYTEFRLILTCTMIKTTEIQQMGMKYMHCFNRKAQWKLTISSINTSFTSNTWKWRNTRTKQSQTVSPASLGIPFKERNSSLSTVLYIHVERVRASHTRVSRTWLYTTENRWNLSGYFCEFAKTSYQSNY